ncbi:MAG: hypothetical protein FWE02_07835 [Defluviitaleaceae bacterium]|nr:hypothetical protein [Defluviitaleaceae bacterium]
MFLNDFQTIAVAILKLYYYMANLKIKRLSNTKLRLGKLVMYHNVSDLSVVAN